MPHLFLWKNRLRAHSSSVFPMKSHSFLFRSVNGAVAGIYTMHYPCCWFALSFGTWCASNRSWNQEENDWDAEKLQSPSLQGFPQFPQVFLLFSHSPTMFLSPLPASSRFPKKISTRQGHMGSTEEGHRAIAQWRRGEGKLDLNGAVHGEHLRFMIELLDKNLLIFGEQLEIAWKSWGNVSSWWQWSFYNGDCFGIGEHVFPRENVVWMGELGAQLNKRTGGWLGHAAPSMCHVLFLELQEGLV